MKTRRQTAVILAAISAALMLCACRFEEHSKEENSAEPKGVLVCGGISIHGCVPQSVARAVVSEEQAPARTAMPSLQADTYAYEVIFTGTTSITIKDEEIRREKNGSTTKLIFEKQIPAGTYTICARAKNSDGDVVLEGEKKDIPVEAEKVMSKVNLMLKPKRSESEKGTFKFAFAIGSETGIANIAVTAHPVMGGGYRNRFERAG